MISVSALLSSSTHRSFRLTTASAHSQLNPLVLGRCVIGGILMGLANLVPGISGGTMLLAAGVYPTFVESVAAVTTLSRRLHPWLLLAFIAIPAVLAIGVLAGTVRDMVLEHRWIAYSLFIGLTLGGAPTLRRMLKPMPARAGIAALVAFIAMVALALLQESQPASSAGEGGMGGLFIAGFAGAAAMVLPGVSGGYLLLVLGQYVPVLDAIDAFKDSIRTGETALMLQSAWPLVAIGVGVLLGVSLVSNIMRWLLKRHREVTLGALLGLLLGAVAGLWPFREAVLPEVGSTVRGEFIESVEAAEAIELKYRPTRSYQPSAGQIGLSLLLVVGGGIGSLLVGRLGADDEGEEASESESGPVHE
jgi:putative membrane protein